MQTRERKEAVAPKIESGGKKGQEEQGDRIFLGRDPVKATQRFLGGCERGEVCFLERRSPFPYWARFLVGGAPPLGAVDWTNSFSDNLCEHPLGLIGSYAQFRRESHPTWSGGVFLSHTLPSCTHPAAAEVGEKVPLLRI